MISFGRTGVFSHLFVAAATTFSLWTIIEYRADMRSAKLATVLLAFSLLSTIAFVGLVVMPYSDIVFR